jgi:hypothetical protein
VTAGLIPNQILKVAMAVAAAVATTMTKRIGLITTAAMIIMTMIWTTT